MKKRRYCKEFQIKKFKISEFAWYEEKVEKLGR